MVEFIKSKYSLEDLEKFRDENGFIDLSQTDIAITEDSREEKGTMGRIKNWVDFNGKKFLLRGDAVDNYSSYAELIVEEIAKKLGIETAHYDLMKLKNEKGEYVTGVISESMLDYDKDNLISLHELIGDEPESDDIDYMSATRYYFTIERLRKYLKENSNNYSEEYIESIILQYKKRLLFALITADTDKHPENISFIINKSGTSSMRISPNYDSEFSLLLDYQKDMVDYYAQNIDMLEDEIDLAEPRIGVIKSINDGGLNSMWKDTLEALIEDDDLYEYYIQYIRGKIDMDEILQNVELRIKAPLPKNVKIVAKKSFELRNKTIERIVDGEFELSYEQDIDLESFLSSIISIGINNGIRTGEQIDIGKKIENDLKDDRIIEKKEEYDKHYRNDDSPNLDDNS